MKTQTAKNNNFKTIKPVFINGIQQATKIRVRWISGNMKGIEMVVDVWHKVVIGKSYKPSGVSGAYLMLEVVE